MLTQPQLTGALYTSHSRSNARNIAMYYIFTMHACNSAEVRIKHSVKQETESGRCT